MDLSIKPFIKFSVPILVGYFINHSYIGLNFVDWLY